MVQAYVLDPGSQSLIDAAVAPFDYGVAATVWMSVFVFVVGLYLASHKVGVLLALIRGR